MRRWEALDGLRGIAVLLVVADHVGLPGHGGRVGVTLFFVLSGFLITNLLVSELNVTERIKLLRFYARRAFRLLPALLVYLLGSGLIALAYGLTPGWVWHETLPPLLYSANYAQFFGWELTMHWHTWSLAVEEHFYLGWPLVLLRFPRLRRPGALLIVVFIFAVWSMGMNTWNLEWAGGATDTNAYAIGLGCLLAVSLPRLPLLRVKDHHPMIGMALIVSLMAVPHNGLRQLGVSVAAVFTIWACVHVKTSLLANPGLVWFGAISYALYLWHVPMLMIAGTNIWMRLVAACGATAIAWISWRFIEAPAMRLRRRLLGPDSIPPRDATVPGLRSQLSGA